MKQDMKDVNQEADRQDAGAAKSPKEKNKPGILFVCLGNE